MTKRKPDPWASRIVSTGAAAPGDLMANPDNWRVHPEHQRNALAAVLDHVGWVQNVIVNRATGRIVDGHLRVELARERGEATVPVAFVDLTPEEEAVILATLDEITGMAETDTEAYDLLLEHTDEAGAELIAKMFDAAETAGQDKAPPSVEDEPPEPPANPITRAGDVWTLGRHRVVCGDSFDEAARAVLTDGMNVAMLATDPPYAIFGSSTGVSSSVTDDKITRPFFEALFRAAWAMLPEFGHAYVCCDWRTWASLWETAQRGGMTPKNMLVWDKGSGGLGNNYANTHELVGYFAKLPRQRAMKQAAKAGQRAVLRPNIIRINRVPGNQRKHNAAKPVELMAELITNSSDPGDGVVDLFAGSGSTLIAAEDLGRRCCSMEIDPAYCDVIVTRWENLTGEKATRTRRGRGKA